jgi:hypothetical protein
MQQQAITAAVEAAIGSARVDLTKLLDDGRVEFDVDDLQAVVAALRNRATTEALRTHMYALGTDAFDMNATQAAFRLKERLDAQVEVRYQQGAPGSFEIVEERLLRPAE